MSTRNVAVFIDAENLFKGYGKLEIPDVSMSDILMQLEDAASREAGAGSIALSRAYADWNALGLEDYRRDVERSGVQTMQVFSAGIASKNAADIELVVDCLRTASDLEQLEVFIIVSGDGDFVPLVRRLHELDKYVIGATLSGHGLNSLLEREVDQYVALKFGLAAAATGLQPVFSADPQVQSQVVAKKSASRGSRRGQAEQTSPVDEAPPTQARESRPAAKKAAKAEPEPKKQSRAKEKAGDKDKAGHKDKAAHKDKAGHKDVESTTRPTSQSATRKGGKPNWHAMAQEIAVLHEGPATSPADYKAVVGTLLADPQVHSFCDRLADHGGKLPVLAMAIKAAAPQLSPSDARVSTLSRALRFALAGTEYALARKSVDDQPALVRRSANPPGMLSDLSLDDIERGTQ